MWFRHTHPRGAARPAACLVQRAGGLAAWTVVVSCAAALADDRSSNLAAPGLPPNLSAAAVFTPYLDLMALASPTFRSQCNRLGAASSVRVQLRVEDAQRRPSYRARTVLTLDRGVVVAAEIFLTPSVDAIELIAHELEHVLEQLDGVDLDAHVGSGHVWKREDGAFETRRATEVGQRVPREVMAHAKAHPSSR